MAGFEPIFAKLTADAGIDGGMRGTGEGLRPPELNANLPRCRHINVPSQPSDAGLRGAAKPRVRRGLLPGDGQWELWGTCGRGIAHGPPGQFRRTMQPSPAFF